jgi:hypothetical protein
MNLPAPFGVGRAEPPLPKEMRPVVVRQGGARLTCHLVIEYVPCAHINELRTSPTCSIRRAMQLSENRGI